MAVSYGITDFMKFLGYAISAIHYLSHGKLNSGTILIGTIMTVVGYSILTIANILPALNKNPDDKENKALTKGFSYVGYIILFLFFLGSFLLPITYNAEYYDWFAVGGYALLIAAMHKVITSMKPGYTLLMAYYLCGAYEASGSIVFGRLFLAIGYIMSLCPFLEAY